MNTPQYPTDEEITQAAEVISRLPPGHMPYPLFMAIASKVVTPTLELGIFHGDGDVLQILLTKRSDDDKYWPGQWHIPGTVILATDTENTFASCFERLLGKELEGLVTITSPTRVGVGFWDIERGRELDQLFCAQLKDVADLPAHIRLFSVDDLPGNIMRHHADIVATMKKAYKRVEG